MNIEITDVNTRLKTEVQDFLDMLSKVDPSSLDPESLGELLATVDDFKVDLSSIANLEVLSQELEQALTAGLANSFMADMKVSSEYNVKLQQQADLKNDKKSNFTLGYDKLTRD
ncbi:hypothetical protein OTK49_26745 [Vibrio coralliirubri]|uniref:hypothetical protein n=1 Tax=Vibrio coralliirubri TaxID=1516159 RepID=UPI002283495B|nr:hypothetical protein [Vibrio coralliirubri]MCY9866140.1 hypothetical protein [Vibrio coralliirubri]